MSVSRAFLLFSLGRVTRAARGFPDTGALLQDLLARVEALPVTTRYDPPRTTDPTPSAPPARPTPQPARETSQRALVVVAPAPLWVSTRAREIPDDPIGERLREAEGARALLLEIIRRAAFDWVLYRSSSRLEQKTLAEDAYTWIFLEDEDHPNFKARAADGKSLTAFVVICDSLDLDPDRVRGYIRNLTPNRVMSSGRPPENSRASDHQMQVEIHARIPESAGGEGFDFDALIGQLLDG